MSPVSQYRATQFTASPAVLSAMERQDTEKLEGVIKEAISSICSKTGLPENDVMDVIGKVRIGMVSELKSALETLDQQGAIKHVDSKELSAAMEHAYRKISDATDLDTDELTDMFTRLKGASMEKIVNRIFTKSRMDRADQV